MHPTKFLGLYALAMRATPQVVNTHTDLLRFTMCSGVVVLSEGFAA
jgi:hypothetical protein